VVFIRRVQVHDRMFESFLDATVRGRALGQFSTPRDIVHLMVRIASIQVTKIHIDKILDACCGSGGFLIAAMNYMVSICQSIAGLSNIDREKIERKIKDESLYGIDSGSNPSIYRIARMNMYLHGDGGSNIFFADSLDKYLGEVGKSNIEDRRQLNELRKLVLDENTKFNIILSNPPFSRKYSRDDRYQSKILAQYLVPQGEPSLLSSIMFLERYKDLVSEDGKIIAIIDESILSGKSYNGIRDFIRNNFIIIGIISLPGDAFRRASARVKTSVLILRLRREGESQPDIFMASAIYSELTP
jgi:type I restriction enzyme M protein